MLLTVAQLRALVETDLSDASLQLLLNAADEEIVRHAGAHASVTETRAGDRCGSIYLWRRAQTITSVHERVGQTETQLDATDYRLSGERLLWRTSSGPNPRKLWGDEVRVIYAPVPDIALRTGVQLDLVRLALQYQGLRSSRIGDVAGELPDYAAERAAILSRLTPALGLV